MEKAGPKVCNFAASCLHPLSFMRVLVFLGCALCFHLGDAFCRQETMKRKIQVFFFFFLNLASASWVNICASQAFPHQTLRAFFPFVPHATTIELVQNILSRF